MDEFGPTVTLETHAAKLLVANGTLGPVLFVANRTPGGCEVDGRFRAVLSVAAHTLALVDAVSGRAVTIGADKIPMAGRQGSRLFGFGQ